MFFVSGSPLAQPVLNFTDTWFVSLCCTVMQAVPLSTRKATAGSSEGIAPLLQLPHFSEAVVKKIARKVSNTVFE